MIVPNDRHGFPEPVATAATEHVYTVLTKAEPFETTVDASRNIVIVPMGAGELTIEDRVRSVRQSVYQPFALNFLPPGEERLIRQGECVESLVVSIASDRMTRFCRAANDSDILSLGSLVAGYSHPDIPLVAQSLRRHLLDPVCVNGIYLNAVADILLTHTIVASESNFDGTGRGRFSKKTLQNVLREIDDRMEGGPQISEIAMRFDMAPSEFSRRFKASVGCSPRKYVNEKRIGQARRLLMNTDDSIADIAFQTGFSSQAHLTTLFKQLIGITPARYRRQSFDDRREEN